MIYYTLREYILRSYNGNYSLVITSLRGFPELSKRLQYGDLAYTWDDIERGEQLFLI